MSDPGECNPDAKRLYDEILSGYNKLVRPVKNVTDPVTVKVKLKLSQLIDVVRQNTFLILKLIQNKHFTFLRHPSNLIYMPQQIKYSDLNA